MSPFVQIYDWLTNEETLTVPHLNELIIKIRQISKRILIRLFPFFKNLPDGAGHSIKCIKSKNRQHFNFKNFLIRCILDYAQRHLVDFWKKRPANFNFIWLEWNSYNSSIQIHIVWSRSSIFKLKSSPAQGCICLAYVQWFKNIGNWLLSLNITWNQQFQTRVHLSPEKTLFLDKPDFFSGFEILVFHS